MGRWTYPRVRFGLLLALFLAAAMAAPAASSASLRTRLDDALSTSRVPRSATGVLAIDLTDGSRVYGLHVGYSFRPASNQKLLVAVAALQRLGSDTRLETLVLGQGALDGTVWRGRLVLKGFGDPMLKSADLATLARIIRGFDITRVTGRIVGDESYFDTRRTAPGWKPGYYKEESPPLSALVVNRAKLDGRVVDSPAWAAAVLFRRALRAEGISVPSRAVAGTASPDALALAGARVVSPPVWRMVRRMNKVSDNFVAEMLLKGLGARFRNSGTTSAGARVVRNVLNGRGVPLEGVRIADGSGLSDYDRLTARALAALLISVWSDSTIDDAFVGSLPIAGVDGTLEDRMTREPAYADVRAKTGTTSRASTLSGYVRTRYVFSILMNGNPVPWWYARRAQDRFAQVLTGAS
jgi:D-alanyl-D-alanine carboxypeptidase/D-alanyl-D-alanine-endopeptidase (penicillin-binding protein 4)